MQKIKMVRGVTLTFEEGCNKYLENCRQRNLREGTIGHYRQSYTQFFKHFDPIVFPRNPPCRDRVRLPTAYSKRLSRQKTGKFRCKTLVKFIYL